MKIDEIVRLISSQMIQAEGLYPWVLEELQKKRNGREVILAASNSQPLAQKFITQEIWSTECDFSMENLLPVNPHKVVGKQLPVILYAEVEEPLPVILYAEVEEPLPVISRMAKEFFSDVPQPALWEISSLFGHTMLQGIFTAPGQELVQAMLPVQTQEPVKQMFSAPIHKKVKKITDAHPLQYLTALPNLLRLLQTQSREIQSLILRRHRSYVMQP